MKKIILFLIIPLVVNCQESNLDKSLGEHGTLFEKNYVNVGTVKGIELVVIKIKNLTKNNSASALRFEMWNSAGSGKEIKAIDSDEIESLTKAFNMIFSSITGTRDSYTEIQYKTRSDMEFGCYYQTSKGKQSTKNEKQYIQTDQQIYEGKQVLSDDKGKFIWKTVSVGSDSEGKWIPYVQMNLIGPDIMKELSQEEFKALYSLIEQSKSKL